LPQAGAQLVPTAVRNGSFGSRPSLCDTPRLRQAATTLAASGGQLSVNIKLLF